MRRLPLAAAALIAAFGLAGSAQAYTAPPPPPGTLGIEPGTPLNADPNRPPLAEPGTRPTATVHCQASESESSATPGPFVPIRPSPCE
jgi:hypothetical protein